MNKLFILSIILIVSSSFMSAMSDVQYNEYCGIEADCPGVAQECHDSCPSAAQDCCDSDDDVYPSEDSCDCPGNYDRQISCCDGNVDCADF